MTSTAVLTATAACAVAPAAPSTPACPSTPARPSTLGWITAALGSPDWVDAWPFRAHLHHLIGTSGLHWRVVACYCGLPARTAQRLVGGGSGPPMRRIGQSGAARLLSVRPGHLAALAGATVSSGATVARLARLEHRGHQVGDVADAVAADGTALTRLLPGRRGTAPARCSRLLHLQVEAACQYLLGDDLPDGVLAERGADPRDPWAAGAPVADR